MHASCKQSHRRVKLCLIWVEAQAKKAIQANFHCALLGGKPICFFFRFQCNIVAILFGRFFIVLWMEFSSLFRVTLCNNFAAFRDFFFKNNKRQSFFIEKKSFFDDGDDVLVANEFRKHKQLCYVGGAHARVVFRHFLLSLLSKEISWMGKLLEKSSKTSSHWNVLFFCDSTMKNERWVYNHVLMRNLFTGACASCKSPARKTQLGRFFSACCRQLTSIHYLCFITCASLSNHKFFFRLFTFKKLKDELNK